MPAAVGTFRASQTPLLLLRVCSSGSKLAETEIEQWKPYAVVDDATDKAINLQISAAKVRGLTVTGRLPLESLNLTPGSHNLTVLFTAPGRKAPTQVLSPHTKFTIEP